MGDAVADSILPRDAGAGTWRGRRSCLFRRRQQRAARKANAALLEQEVANEGRQAVQLDSRAMQTTAAQALASVTEPSMQPVPFPGAIAALRADDDGDGQAACEPQALIEAFES